LILHDNQKNKTKDDFDAMLPVPSSAAATAVEEKGMVPATYRNNGK